MAKKRRKLFSKTVLVYMLTFIVVTFATAFLTVTVNYDNYMLNNSSTLIGNTGDSGSSALSNTLSNLMAISGGNVNVSMSAESEQGETLDIDANIKLKMEGGIENLELSVDVVLYFNDEPFVLRVAVTKGVLYLSVNDSHLKFESENMVDAVVGVLGVIGMGAEGAGDIASMFDMNALMGMASSIKEVATESGTSLKIEDANMNVSMNVTEDFMLESIDIGTIAVGSYTATGEVVMSDINSATITVEPPMAETEYEDISVPVRLFSALAGMSTGDFRARATLGALGAKITGDIIYDKASNIGKAEIGAGAIDFDVYIAGGNFYLSSNNAKIKAEDLSATSFIAGLGVLFNEMGNYVEVDENTANSFDLSVLTNLDLADLVNEFKADGNTITVSIFEQDIKFVLDDDDKLLQISTNGDLDFCVDFEHRDQKIFFSDFGYVPIQKMGWVLEPLTKFITTSKFSTTINFAYGDLAGELMLRVDLADKRAIQLNTELFGKTIEAIVDGEYILLTIDGESTKINFENSVILALAIFDKFAGEIEINTAISIQNLLDSAMSLIFADENAIYMQGKNSALHYSADGFITYNGVLNGKDVYFDIELDKVPRRIREYHVELYSDFMFTSALAKNIIEYINGKVYNISVSGLFEGNNVYVDAFADLNSNRYALDITFNGEKVNVVMEDDVYYIAYRQFKFYGSMQSAFALLGSAVSVNSNDQMFASNIQTLTGKIQASLQDIDFINIITGIKIGEINIENDKFGISMEKLVGLENVLDIENIYFELQTQNSNLDSVLVKYNDNSLNMQISRDYVPALSDAQKLEYKISLDNLYELGINTIDYVKGGVYNFRVDCAYDTYFVSGNIGLAGKDFLADLTFDIGEDNVYVKVVDETIFVNFANLAFSAKMDDIGLVIELLGKFGVEVNTNDLIKVVGGIIAASDIKLTDSTFADILNNIDINQIVLDNNSGVYEIGYGDYSVFVRTENNSLVGMNTSVSGAQIDIQLIDGFSVVPSGDYVEAGDILKLAINTYDYITSDDYKFKIELGYENYKVVGLAGYSAGNLAASLEIDIAGEKVYLKLLGGKLYVNYANLAIVGEAGDIAKLTAILAEFGFNVDVEELVAMLEELTAKLDNASMPTFDIYKLTLTENDGIFTIGYDGYNVLLQTKNNKLYSISTAICGAEAALTIVDSVNVVVSGNYVKAGDLIDLGKSVYDYVNGNIYNFQIAASYTDYSVNGVVRYSAGNLVASLEIDIAGEKVYLKLLGGKLYINYANLAIVGEASDIAKLTAILAEFGFNVDVEELVAMLEDITAKLDETSMPTFDIYKLTLTENDGIFTIGYDGYNVLLQTKDNKLYSISTAICGAEAALTIVDSVNVVVSGNYVKAGDLIDLGKNVYDYVMGGSYIFDIYAEYDNYTLDGKLGVVEGELTSDLTISIGDENIYVKIVGGTLYLDYSNLYLSSTLADVDSLSTLLAKLGVNADSNAVTDIIGVTDELASAKSENLSVKDLLAAFDVNNIVLQKVDNVYSVGYGDYVININTLENEIVDLSTSIAGAIVKIDLIESFDVTIENDYVAVGKLLKLISNEIDYIGSDIAFNFNCVVDGFDLGGKINIIDGEVESSISTMAAGEPITITFKNNTLFVDVNGLKVSGGAADYERLAYFIEKNTGVVLPNIYNFNIKEVVDCYMDVSAIAANLFGANLPELPEMGGEVNMDAAVILGALKTLSFVETENGYNISLDGIDVNLFVADDKLSAINLGLSVGNVQLEKTAINKIDVRPQSFIACGDFVTVLDKTVNTLATGAMTGVINLDFIFEDIKHQVDIAYNINYQDLSDIRGKINFIFKGVTAEIIYTKGMLYLDIAGLKLNVPLKDYKEIIDFIETRFKVDTGFDELLDNLFKDIESYDFIEQWDITDAYADFMLKGGLGIDLVFNGDKIETVNFSQGTVNALITLVPMSEVVIPTNFSEHRSYTEIFDLIDGVLALADREGFNLHADAFVYDGNSKRFNVAIDLALHIKNYIKMYGEAHVTNGAGVLEHSLIAALDNQTIYADYKGLKLQMQQGSLMEILVIALSALGIDASSIPWLNAVDDDFKIVPENMKDIMPVFKLDTLGMLAIIKSMSFDGDILEVTLNGDLISAAATKPMTIAINFAGNQINSINLYNIYTGVTDEEYFNLEIKFNNYEGVTTLEDKDAVDSKGEPVYKNVSGVSDLLAAFVNTTELNDYTIAGNVTFSAAGLINMTVNVNASVKILEDKTVYAQIGITNIPVVGIINGQDNTDIENRAFYIYMRDNIVYMHRTERQRSTFLGIPTSSWRTVEKKLSVTMEQFMAKALDYIMCFGLGFEEGGTIMDAIYESMKINRPEDEPLNYGNILLSYLEKENNSHYVQINLNELTYNENLKTIDATISTINNASTGNKDYLYNLAFNLVMPVSIVTLTLKSDNIQLKNIGQAADVSQATNYINSYNYKLGECYIVTDGSAVLESNLTYSAYFINGDTIVRTEEDNSGEPLDMTGVTKPNAVVNGVEYAYTFNGWYTDSACTKKFTSGVMPTGGVYLYAGFTATAYRNVYFDEQGGAAAEDKYVLAGSSVTLPTLANKFVTSGAYTYEYAFDYWTLDGELVDNNYTVPDRNVTLVAVWKHINTTIANSLVTIVFGDGSTVSQRVEVGSALDLYTFDRVQSSTKFYTDSAFKNAFTASVVPSEDLTVYAANEFTIYFSTGTSETVKAVTCYEGTEFALQNITRDYYDDGTQTCRIVYTFAGWYFEGDADTLYTGKMKMPYGGGTLIAKWTSQTLNYYTISFKVDTIDHWLYSYTFSSTPASVKVLQGTYYTIPTSGNYKPTASYKPLLSSRKYATFNGWKYNGSVVSGFTVNGNVTLEASWTAP